jgi:choice-of-anchor B domain-containing protein
MRARLAATITAAFLISVVGAGAAAAHDEAGEAYTLPGQDSKAEQYEDVRAANANESSNAPKSFAPCVRGKSAGMYPCDGVDMMSNVPLSELGLSFGNDIWGWTDSATGDEYALMGGIEGTAFVDISDPKRPVVLGLLPTRSTEGGDFWRDIKVYEDHAYIVSENDGHGMQVFDLTQLRDVSERKVFTATAVYDGFSSAHNININEDTGFGYVIGTDTCEGGLHMVNLSDSQSPQFAGCFQEHGYIHDTQCVVYSGPDAEHQGREICFSSNAEIPATGFADIENRLSIVDVTDKTNPVALSRTPYENDGYSHQGWLTPDQGTFLHGDELDELFDEVDATTTRVWDVQDLDAPFVEGVYSNGTTSIDHNLYTKGNRAFASNYTSGLRVFDTSAAADGQLSEVGFFDLYPENDNASFEGGTWSNYPYFKKVVAVSSIDRGLFILKPMGNVG